MRLFLIGWDDVDVEMTNVALALQQNGHQILYCTKSVVTAATRADFPHTIFHEIEDALAGRGAHGVNMTDFLPPGRGLLSQLYETESVVLTMMNKRYDWMGVSERKHLYYRMVGYWNGVFEKHSPDAIIFRAPPHTVYDYVIYALAKLRGSVTIMLDDTVVSDRLLVMRDFKEGSNTLVESLERNRGRHHTLADLSQDLNEYYKRQTDPRVDATPLYMKKSFKAYSFLNVLRLKLNMIKTSLHDLTFIVKVARFVYKKFQPSIKDEYTSTQSVPDWSKKFIYVPLQYQPECTTSTLGGVFVDQILMIEILSAALPDGWSIFVKEHPTQWLPRGLNFFSSRYRGYYKAISSIPHVSVVPLQTNTYELLEKCQAVATVTGTAGWEGALRLKPALTFGYPWYQHCPGVFRVVDVQSCRKALEAVSAHTVGATNQDIIDYLYAFDQASFHGYVQLYGREISQVSSADNVAAILRALHDELTKSSSIRTMSN